MLAPKGKAGRPPAHQLRMGQAEVVLRDFGVPSMVDREEQTARPQGAARLPGHPSGQGAGNVPQHVDREDGVGFFGREDGPAGIGVDQGDARRKAPGGRFEHERREVGPCQAGTRKRAGENSQGVAGTAAELGDELWIQALQQSNDAGVGSALIEPVIEATNPAIVKTDCPR